MAPFILSTSMELCRFSALSESRTMSSANIKILMSSPPAIFTPVFCVFTSMARSLIYMAKWGAERVSPCLTPAVCWNRSVNSREYNWPSYMFCITWSSLPWTPADSSLYKGMGSLYCRKPLRNWRNNSMLIVPFVFYFALWWLGQICGLGRSATCEIHSVHQQIYNLFPYTVLTASLLWN